MSKSVKPIHNNTPPADTQNNPFLLVLWKVIRNACCIFTLCSIVLILVNWAIAGTLDDAVIFVDAFFLLYVSSLGVSAAHTLRMSKGVPLWAKCVCHPLLCMGGIVIAYIPYMTRNNFPAGTVMVHLLAFAVVYVLVMVGIYLVTSLKRGKKDTSSQDAKDTYQPLFSKKGDDH